MKVVLLTSALTLGGCVATTMDSTISGGTSVSVSIQRHWIDSAGNLHAVVIFTNGGSEEVCLGDPPDTSMSIRVLDISSGHLVIARQAEELYDQQESDPNNWRHKRSTLHIRPSEEILVRTMSSPIKDPHLVDPQFVRKAGAVNRENLSIFVGVTTTSCEFSDPDEALRDGQMQRYRSKPVKLVGDIDKFIK